MTKRIIISLAQENQAVEENEITGAAIDQTKEQEQSSQAGAVVVPLEDSEEEIAAILAVEELSEEIANDQTDAERSIEVADGLEDVATIAENIDQPSPTDIALIQTAANMAVAGTDGDATALVPAAESITSGKALAADLRERIGYAHEGIMDAFKGIGEKLATLGERIGEKLRSFSGRVANVRKALNASNNTKFTVKIKEGDFKVASNVKIGSGSDFIKIVNQTMAFQEDLVQQASVTNQALSSVKTTLLDNLKANYTKNGAAVQAYKHLNPLIAATGKLTSLKGSVKNTINNDGSVTTVLVPAIGDFVLRVTTPTKESSTSDGMSIKDFLAIYKKYDIEFVKNVNGQDVQGAEFEVNKQYLEGLVATVEKMANTALTFVKSNTTFSQRLIDKTGGYQENRYAGSAAQVVVGRATNMNFSFMKGVEKLSDNVARGLLRVAIRAVNGKEEVAQESFNV